MWPEFAFYIPHPERAVGPALIQFVLITILAGALYAYLHPRRGRRATIAALVIGEVISLLPLGMAMLVGLGTCGDIWRDFGANYTDAVLILIQYFEQYGFALWSFICLLVSAMILFLIGTGERQHEHGGKDESPPGASSPGAVA
jgi:hypothetical protein